MVSPTPPLVGPGPPGHTEAHPGGGLRDSQSWLPLLPTGADTQADQGRQGWCGEGRIQIPTLRGPEREVPIWEAGCLPPAGPVSVLPLHSGTRLKGDTPLLPPPRGIPALRCPEPALAQAFSLLLSLGGLFGGRVSGTGGGH